MLLRIYLRATPPRFCTGTGAGAGTGNGADAGTDRYCTPVTEPKPGEQALLRYCAVDPPIICARGCDRRWLYRRLGVVAVCLVRRGELVTDYTSRARTTWCNAAVGLFVPSGSRMAMYARSRAGVT